MSILDTKEGREVLSFALAGAIKIDTGEVLGFICGPLSDPAKLAELLAEALRERGLTDSLIGGEWYALPLPDESGGIDFVIEDPDGIDKSRVLTMPQARAALLRVLTLPEGATAEDAMKAAEANNG